METFAKMSHLEISDYFSQMIESVEKSKNFRKASKKRFQPVDMKVIDQAVEENDFEFVKNVLDQIQSRNYSRRKFSHAKPLKG